MKLRALAPSKVNLSLFLGEIRADGRHDLVTLLESISLADELTLWTLPPGASGDEVVCPGVEGPNLVSAALAALRGRGWDAPPVRIEIVKRIPVAAGMGGGSADAAAALRLAVELAPARGEEVAEVAASLGADVPSQLVPGLVLGTGAGEIVERFEPLEQHTVLVLPQPHALSTADVYRAADQLGLSRSSEDLGPRYDELVAALNPGARLLERLLVNDLEPAALSLHPDIHAAITATREAGADRSLVCGSGPTVVGLFWGREDDGAAARARAEAAAEALVGRYPRVFVAAPVDPAFGAARQVA